jgi:carboxylesterase
MSTRFPRTSKRSYHLPGDKAEALFFNGYNGSPYYLRIVSDFLSARGIAVHVPLLSGHGSRPDKLLTVTADDWLHEARAAFATLNHNLPIILGGLSMGALLAILLAAEHPHSRALLLFSPSLKLNPLADLTILAAKLGFVDKTLSLKKLSGGSDIADPKAKACTPSYLEMPVVGILELEKLRVMALANIKKVACPIFLAFGKNDGAINTIESQNAVAMNTHQPLMSKFYSRSRHVITLDYDRDLICADLSHFLSGSCGITL